MKRTFAMIWVLSAILSGPISNVRADMAEVELESDIEFEEDEISERRVNIRTQPLAMINKNVGLKADFGVARKVSVGPQYYFYNCGGCSAMHSVGGQMTVNVTGEALNDGAILATDLSFWKMISTMYVASPALLGGYQWFSTSGVSARLAVGAEKSYSYSTVSGSYWFDTAFRTDFSVGYSF